METMVPKARFPVSSSLLVTQTVKIVAVSTVSASSCMASVALLHQLLYQLLQDVKRVIHSKRHKGHMPS